MLTCAKQQEGMTKGKGQAVERLYGQVHSGPEDGVTKPKGLHHSHRYMLQTDNRLIETVAPAVFKVQGNN